MSLKGTAMTDKVLRGKINNIWQIEDVNALHAEAERLIESANNVLQADDVVTAAREAAEKAEEISEKVENEIYNAWNDTENGYKKEFDEKLSEVEEKITKVNEEIIIEWDNGNGEGLKHEINDSIDTLNINNASFEKDVLFAWNGNGDSIGLKAEIEQAVEAASSSSQKVKNEIIDVWENETGSGLKKDIEEVLDDAESQVESFRSIQNLWQNPQNGSGLYKNITNATKDANTAASVANAAAGTVSNSVAEATRQANYAKNQGDYAKAAGEQAYTEAASARLATQTANEVARNLVNAKNNGEFNGAKGDKGDSADDLSILANALKGSSNGNPIVLTDVSPLEHELKVSVDVGGATVTKYGKNIFYFPRTGEVKSVNGITFTNNGDGTITANGTATATATILYRNRKFFLPKGSYFYSAKIGHINTDVNVLIAFRNASETILYQFREEGKGKAFTLSENATDIYHEIIVRGGQTVNNLVFKPQIEVGSAFTGYEPYKEPTTYTADENGNVEGIIGSGEGMTLFADEGISISAEYNKDLNKVVNDIYQKLSALGVAVVNN